MPKKYLFVAVACCGLATWSAAQEVVMDVKDVISLIGEQNADVRSAKSSYAVAAQGVSVAKAARLPHVEASLDLTYIGDGTILDRDFSNAMRDRLPHFGNTLNLTLYQPVYQGGAISAGIDLALQQTELAAISLNQTLDASSIEALGNYFNLLKMSNLREVYVENIDITRKLIAQMTEHYNQGTALRNDVTRYELRLSSLNYDLTSIDNTLSVLNTNLTTLLGMDAGSVIIPGIDISGDLDINTEDYWQQSTTANSNELKAIDKTAEIASIALRLEKAAMLPSVGVVVGDKLSGPVTFEIPAINKNYNAWFAGVSLSYNISSLWTSNKRLKQKQLEIIHTQDNRSAIEVALRRRIHEAYTAAMQAQQMLATEMVNVRLANENYSVVETRFQNDMALLTDMLDASTAKLDAETRLVNARINMYLSYYQLKFISGTLSTL